MSGLKKLLGSRLPFIGMLILLQVGVLVIGLYRLSQWLLPLYIALYILGIGITLYILNADIAPGYQYIWLILGAAFPLVTGVLYLIFGAKRVAPKFRREHLLTEEKFRPLQEIADYLPEVEEKDASAFRQMKYIRDFSFYPVHKFTAVDYFSTGEDMFSAIIEELKKAKHFIFIEMFIIQEGKVLNTVLDILEEKVKQGVDVRFIYDDLGCAMYVPKNYSEKLEARGIKCQVFNPVRPILLVTMNNRDHRKLVIIDGQVAFTGGINFSDEYINEVELYGHWKDAGVMLKGEAVTNMLVMFLQLWDSDKFDQPLQIPGFEDLHIGSNAKGYVQPFSDTPTDSENVGKGTHLNIIWNAKKYVYIMTPYLVVDEEILGALKQVSKNGVDVRIFVPHIPDKWYVLEVTRSYYHALMSSGVKIYEYSPGFIHSKVMMADDEIAIVGSINMDYRSYYLSFESAVFMYDVPCIRDIRKDFEKTIEESELISMDQVNKVSVIRRVVRAVLRLFAPLM